MNQSDGLSSLPLEGLEEGNDSSQRVACRICARKFLPERLSKHMEVCERQKQKKRKVFDSSKQRAPVDDKGDPLLVLPSSPVKTTNHGRHNKTSSQSKKHGEPTHNNSSTNNNSTNTSDSKKSNWREQHEQFIRTVREARGLKVDPEPLDDDGKKRLPPGYVECPSCERRFSRAAADRHIPWCKEQKSRVPRSPQVTKEVFNRVKARSKYKPGIVVTPSSSGSSKKSESGASSAGSEQGDPSLTVTSIGSPYDQSSSSHHLLSPPASKKAIPRYKSPSRKDNTTPSKVKTRWKSDDNGGKQNHPKTPVMKFKEKFPNHVRSSLDSITTNYLQNTEKSQDILKRPENITGPMIPKTVPGVRTRGLSPMRNEENDVARLKMFDRFILPNGEANVDSNRHSTSGSSESGSTARPSDTVDSELPRFCHQCGTKYSTHGAKYCHECGARRLGSGGPFLDQFTTWLNGQPKDGFIGFG